MKKHLVSVTNAEFVFEYKLLLRFDDGSVRLVDLKNHLNGKIFEPLLDLEYFRTVRADPDLDTIVWDNGADMSPGFLYNISEVVSEPLVTA